MLMAELIDVCVEHNISEPEIVDEAEISHDIISNDDEVHCIGEKFAYDSDQLHTPPESEDDEEYEMFITYKVDEGTKFQFDMVFNNKELVRDAIKEYAMEEKKMHT
ncbi:hypothetical protein KIW84_065592 [Lathyrus oleraceus]|uniref:Uncharacterized protein n=1 Tax=Pisum sativum TaxID=3888 RepID=A0A9D4WFV8_PEA|nr:hypothetical protein KIW84_065592 [Pisum sativum]